jgi:hypothetical protein
VARTAADVRIRNPEFLFQWEIGRFGQLDKSIHVLNNGLASMSLSAAEVAASSDAHPLLITTSQSASLMDLCLSADLRTTSGWDSGW